MDGDPVIGEPSGSNMFDGGDGHTDDVAPKSLAEVFTELCPQYMAMGMSYREFWHCNTKVHYAYRKAFEEKKRDRNWERWMQGAYFYDALLKVAPVMRAAFGKGRVEAGKYVDEPYPLTQKEAKAIVERKRVENMKRMLAIFEKESAMNAAAKESKQKITDNDSTTDAQEGGTENHA